MDDLDVGKLKTIPIYSKKLSDLVSKEVDRNKIQHMKVGPSHSKKKLFQFASMKAL